MKITGLQAALLLVLAFSFIVFYSLLVEPYNVAVTETHIDFFEGDSEPLKIVLISDTQGAYDHPEYFRNAMELASRQEPDLMLIAGDIVDGEPRGWEKLGSLRSLRAKNGVYAVLGNHDYRDWDCSDPSIYEYADNVEMTVESYGIEVLRNENRTFLINGRQLAIAGIDDNWACRSDAETALSGLGNIPKIVLVHEQEAAYKLSATCRTLVFAGHTHCGQFYFPFVTDYLTDYLGFGKIRQGLGTLPNGMEAYVTCGITPGGIRLFARPEISVIYLE